MLTPQERRLRLFLNILALVFGLAVLGYLLPALIPAMELQPFFINLPFVTNSVVKIGVLALLAFIAAADVRRYRVLTILVIAGHVISELATGAVLIWGNTGYTADASSLPGGVISPSLQGTPITTLLVGSMVLDGVIIILLVWFFLAADRARYNLVYFQPIQFRTLTALAEVVVTGDGRVLEPEQVARNVDNYLVSFRARSKWIMPLVLTGIQFYPLLSLKPPFTYLAPDQRLAFLKRRFYQDVTNRLVPEFWRVIVQGMIRMGKQLCYLGYYNDPRTYPSIGYVPFSEREPEKHRKALENRPRRPLKVRTASNIDGDVITGDVVIIGSGAAASIMARGIVASGREVLMLERGDYIDPGEFNENEVDMFSKLYADGALQLTRDFRFQAIQGNCVGGTTVVNNAVCFRLPDHVLERWNDTDALDAGIDPARLADSFAYIENLLDIQPQGPDYLNKGARTFTDGIKNLGYNLPPNGFGEISANIDKSCLGCGYCNIGCKYGKKLSMLDTVLPQTQEQYNRNGHDGLRIVAGCEVEKLRGSGRRITSVICRLSDGRKVEVRGNTFVVAAGAISSSLLLLRSDVGGKQVGRNVSFNMGSPLTGVFREKLNSYDGLQISHYLKIHPSRGYVIETWYNPPVTQALNMPGWFDDHFRNMLSYDRIACTGVLVGTEANATVRYAGLTGRDIEYTPTRGDLDKLFEGLILSGEIFFASGAEFVMPATFAYHEFRNMDELRKLPTLVKDASDITIGTGHPQGGNAISRKRERGVVNEEFRVNGYDNLYLCDASVFPSSIEVNPQLTVMALANYAVPHIIGAAPGPVTASSIPFVSPVGEKVNHGNHG